MFRILPAGEQLQQQRELIIRALNNKAKLLNLQLTLVFDGHYSEGESSRSHYNAIEVHYSAFGEIADDYIFSFIKKSASTRHIILVTSDNKLAWRARRLGAKTESVESFLKYLEQRTVNRTRKRPPQKIEPIPKTGPSGQNNDDNLFEYYLKVFETEDSKPQKKKKKAISDRERWQNIFERKVEENDFGA